MKTKISWILLGLGLSCGAAFAAHMEETPMPVSNDINVTAPDQPGTWSFGATAVLMQPTNQAFSYAYLLTETDVNNYQSVNQTYHWWFGADITYGFPGNGRDVTLAYEGLHGNDTDHASPTDDQILISTPFEEEFDTAKGEIQTTYDAGDLLLGQKLNVGTRIRLHPFMGVRYAYINEKNTGSYTESEFDGDDTVVEQNTWKGTFNGIGPRFGSDAEINLGQGFSVRARLGLSALIGRANPDFSETAQISEDGELLLNGDYSSGHGSSTHVVPEIDGRLGLNYTYHFDSSMALGVEAGWQVTNYFNAIYQDQLSFNGGGVDGYTDVVTSSNFGLQGPYARLQLDIA